MPGTSALKSTGVSWLLCEAGITEYLVGVKSVPGKWRNFLRSVWFKWHFSTSHCQFSSVLSHVQLFATPWTAACQASLSITNSRSFLKLTSIESVMPSNHLILCHPLLLLPSIIPSIRVFSNTSHCIFVHHKPVSQIANPPSSNAFRWH